MISATMAHNMSTIANDKRPEKELKRVEDTIKQAIEKGEYRVNIDHFLYTENIKILQDLGYRVQLIYDPYKQAYTNIRW